MYVMMNDIIRISQNNFLVLFLHFENCVCRIMYKGKIHVTNVENIEVQ